MHFETPGIQPPDQLCHLTFSTTRNEPRHEHGDRNLWRRVHIGYLSKGGATPLEARSKEDGRDYWRKRFQTDEVGLGV